MPVVITLLHSDEDGWVEDFLIIRFCRLPRCCRDALKGDWNPDLPSTVVMVEPKWRPLKFNLQGAKQISSDPNVGALAGIVSVSLKEDQQQETADLPDHNSDCGGLML